jgi:hypothetical protein
MTPSRMGALIAVWLVGLSEEAGAQPAAGEMKLSEPFTGTAARKPAPAVPRVELTPPGQAERAAQPEPSPAAVRPPEPLAGDATLRAETEERCEAGEPPQVRTVPPDPAKMQQFVPGQVVLRWTSPRQAVTRAALLFEQSSHELDLRRCFRLPSPERPRAPVH